MKMRTQSLHQLWKWFVLTFFGLWSTSIIAATKPCEITFFSPPPAAFVARESQLQAIVQVRNNTTTIRSFWVGFSFADEAATEASYPAGYFDLPPIQTAQLSPNATQTLTFTFKPHKALKPGKYFARASTWEGFDAQRYRMIAPRHDDTLHNPTHPEWMTAQVNPTGLASFRLGAYETTGIAILDQLNYFSEQIIFGSDLRSKYQAGCKPLFYLKAEVGGTIPGASGLNVMAGGSFLIDLADLAEVTPEGKEGWVTVWIDGQAGLGSPGRFDQGIRADAGIVCHNFSYAERATADDRRNLNVSGTVAVPLFEITLFEYDSASGWQKPRMEWSGNFDFGADVIGTATGYVRFEVNKNAFRQAFVNSENRFKAASNRTSSLFVRILNEEIYSLFTQQLFRTATWDDGDWDLVSLQREFPLDLSKSWNSADKYAHYFVVDVPSGSDNLTVQTSRGTGNADLYLKRAGRPLGIESGNYDFRSAGFGNTELINVANPQAGKWYAMVTTPSAFSGIELLARVSDQVGTAITAITTEWDDAKSGGDGDGRIEGGETVKLRARLTSNATINQVTATLYSSVPGVQIVDQEIDFPSFNPGQSQYGEDAFDLFLDLTAFTGAVFQMEIRYYQSGFPYRQTFQISKDILAPADAAFTVQSIRVDDNTSRYGGNNNDATIQSGESVRIYPRLLNNGVATATRVDVWLEHANPIALIEIPDAGQQNAERYPDLSAGASAEPNNNSDFAVYVADRSFSGTLFADVLVKWDQAASPVRLQNGLRIDVAPTPWLSFGPKTYSFGVAKPGTNLTYVLNLSNPGSAPLQVTGLSPSHPDTTVSGVALPFTLNPGQAQAVTVAFNTAGLQAQVSRSVTVISNGRVSNPNQDNVLTLTGLVSDSVPVFQVPSSNIVNDTLSVDIWGPWIVWQDNARGIIDVRAYNVMTTSNLLITTNAAEHFKPRIHNNIIAWDDRRNNTAIDIYAFDLLTGSEFVVSTDPAAERLIGVDNGKVAYVRNDFSFLSFGQMIAGYNIYLYDVQSGTTTKLTDYAAPVAGSPAFSAPSSHGLYRMDFADGMIVWREGRRNWVSAQSGWDSGESGSIAKFKLGADTSKVIVPGSPERGPQTAGGRIVWVKEDANSTDQLWIWENGTSRQLTSQNFDLAEDVLAIGANHIVYDKNGVSGLFYYDLQANSERLLTNDTSYAESGRMDGNGVVWFAYSPVRVLYAFVDQPDVSISSGDVVPSKPIANDTDVLGVTATVRNTTDFDSTANLLVQLYRNDPDSGGTQVGTDQTLGGGIGARSSRVVSFTGIPAGSEGTNTFFVRLFPAGVDNVANNKASVSLIVLDSDLSGPSVTNLLVAELNGDGDGTIGSDEQFRVSWQLSDASGIGSLQLLIDGVLTVHTQASGTNTATVGPLSAGPHQVEIRATDGDASPASSTNVFMVNVSKAENIAVSYAGVRLTNSGNAINLGAFAVGAPESRLFSVQNLGEQGLLIAGLSTTGAISSATLGTSNVVAGGIAVLAITPSAQAVGVFTAQVSITNSDALNSTFRLPITWQVQGQAPGILSQPGSVTAPLGASALLSVSASGTQPLVYQWSRGGTNLVNGGRVSGADSATLSITNLLAGDEGTYTVTVANAFGSTNSAGAMLTIPPTLLLSYSLPGQFVNLRWANTTSVYDIEIADDLQNGGSWRQATGISATPVLIDGTNTTGFSVIRAMQFYRLKKRPPPVPQGNGTIYDTDHITPIGSAFKGQIYVGAQANGAGMVPYGTSGVFFNGRLFASQTTTPVPGFFENQQLYIQIKAWEASKAATFEGLPLFNQGKTAVTQIYSLLNLGPPAFQLISEGFPNLAVAEAQ